MSSARGWLIRVLLLAGMGLMIAPLAMSQERTRVRGNARIKQLEEEVKELEGRERVDMLNELAFEWYSFDTKKAAESATEALQLSKKIKYDKGQSQALVYIGMFERLTGDQQKARSYLKEGVHYAKRANDIPTEGYALIQLANFYSTLGRLDSAHLVYSDGYKILKDSLHPFQLSSLYKNWAKLYGARNERVKQKNLLMRSLRIREIMKDPLLMSDIYLNLANYYTQEQNFTEAWKYIKKSEELQPLLGGDLESVYDLKYHKAMLHFKQMNYSEALNLYYEVKIFYKENFPRQDYVALIIDMAYILSDLGNYELSLSNSYEGLTIAEENGFQLEHTKLLWQIGWVYVNLKQLPLAKEFARKALREAQANGFKIEESFAYNLLGVIYDYDSKNDSALFYFDKALALREQLNDITRVASTLNNIGAVLEKEGKYKESLVIQFRSLRLEESGTNYIGVAWTNFSIGQLYYKMGNSTTALRYLNKAEAFAAQNQVKQMLHDVYQVKAKLYEKEGNLALSIRYLKAYDALRDSLVSSNLSNRIAGLQSEYNLLQKNQEIENLSRDKELREAQLNIEQGRVRQQRIVITKTCKR